MKLLCPIGCPLMIAAIAFWPMAAHAQAGEILVNPSDPAYTRIANGILTTDLFTQEVGSVQYPAELPGLQVSKPIMVVNSPFTNLDEYLNKREGGFKGYKWTIKYPVLLNSLLLSEQQKRDLDYMKYSDVRYFSPSESAKMFPFCGCPFGVYRLR